MIFYAIAAFAVSVLAGTGVGGGGLFVIYLTAICGTAQTKAQAINLVFFICAALAALPYHFTHRKMKLRLILFCTVFAVIGTLVGGALRQATSERTLQVIFGVMLVITGARTLFKKSEIPK